MSEHIPTWPLRTAALAAVTAVAMIIPTASLAPEQHILIAAEGAPPVDLDNPIACLPIDPNAMKAAQKLMDQPQNPFFDPANIDILYSRDALENFQLTTATRLGLHVVPRTAELDLLERFDPYDAGSPPFATYLRATQGYMSYFGVTIDIGPSSTDKAKKPTQAQFESGTAKSDLMDVVSAFQGTPVEYIRGITGLRDIRLVTDPETKSDGKWVKDAAYATSDKNGNRIVMDVTQPINNQVVKHEVSHPEDVATCGGSNRANVDFEFENLAHTPYIYEPWKSVYSYTGNWLAARARIMTKYYNSIRNKMSFKPAAYCDAIKALQTEAAKVQTYSDYHTNVMEDKAETIKNILNPYMWPVLTDKHFPVLYNKFNIILARLYTFSPSLAKYFATISPRTDSFAPLADKNCSPNTPYSLEIPY